MRSQQRESKSDEEEREREREREKKSTEQENATDVTRRLTSLLTQADLPFSSSSSSLSPACFVIFSEGWLVGGGVGDPHPPAHSSACVCVCVCVYMSLALAHRRAILTQKYPPPSFPSTALPYPGKKGTSRSEATFMRPSCCLAVVLTAQHIFALSFPLSGAAAVDFFHTPSVFSLSVCVLRNVVLLYSAIR